MTNALIQLKLIDYLTTELDVPKNDFVTNLRSIVDEGSIGYFSDLFDVFSSGENEYKGEVNFNGFKIKRKRRFFDTQRTMAVATGTFRQKDNQLIIQTEINGFHNGMILYYIFIIVFYIIFINLFFTFDTFSPGGQPFVIPFIIIHGIFMFGLPYFIMRRSTKRLKRELEREFYFLTKKN